MALSWPDAARIVLKEQNKPLTNTQILNAVEKAGLKKITGKTPARSLSVALNKLVRAGLAERKEGGVFVITDSGKAESFSAPDSKKAEGAKTPATKPKSAKDKKSSAAKTKSAKNKKSSATKETSKTRVEVTSPDTKTADTTKEKPSAALKPLQPEQRAEPATNKPEATKEKATATTQTNAQSHKEAKHPDNTAAQQTPSTNTTSKETTPTRTVTEELTDQQQTEAALKAQWREAILTIIERANCPVEKNVIRTRVLNTYPYLDLEGDTRSIVDKYLAHLAHVKVLKELMPGLYVTGPAVRTVRRFKLPEAQVTATPAGSPARTRISPQTSRSLPQEPIVSASQVHVGYRWKRSKVNWSSGKLRGVDPLTKKNRNYADETGIFALFDKGELVYIGVASANSSLFQELKMCVTNALSVHWDEFTWVISSTLATSAAFSSAVAIASPQVNRELGFKEPFIRVEQIAK